MEVLDNNREIVTAAANQSSASQHQHGQNNATESRESLEINNLPQSLALIPAGLEVVPESDKELVRTEKEAVQAEKEAISGEEKEVVEHKIQPDGWHAIWQRRKTSRRVRGMKTRILIAVAMSIAVAIALGAGLGTGLQHANSTSGDPTSGSEGQSASFTATVTSTIAASGTYALSLSEPTHVQDGCLDNSGLNQAWDCDLTGAPALAISIGLPAAPQPSEGALFFYASSDSAFEYGAQYKYMNTQFAPYQAVQETDEEGPAFYFGQTYDKIVLLPESTFPVPSGAPKKRDYHMPLGFTKNRQLVRGDKPWMCVWNDTLIEGWIYTEQNVTSTTSSSPPSTPNSNSKPTESIVPTSTSDSSATTTLPASTVASSSQRDYTDRKRQLQRRQTTSSSITLDDNEEELITDRSETLDYYHSLARYPHPIKIEERRVNKYADGNAPYCQLFQLLDSELQPFTDQNYPNGIKFDLSETPPDYTAYHQNASASTTSRSTKRQTQANACHCEWWAQ
jgi:hypothetical protein